MHTSIEPATRVNTVTPPIGVSQSCLHELFEVHAKRAPHAIAVTCGGASLTYGELDTRAEQLARHLQRAGVVRDTLCALYVPRSVEMVIGMFAILKAGAAYVPVDVTYPLERVRFMLDDAAPRVVLTRRDYAAHLPPHNGAQVFCIDADIEETDEELARDATPDDLAYMIYTSGSTGQPKGVQINHAGAVHLFNITRPDFAFTARDVWTVFHSYSFDLSVWEIFGALTTGARLVIVPTEIAQSPVAFLELLRTERVTILNQTPAAINQLLRAREVVDDDAQSSLSAHLRLLICGGEALPSNLARRLLKWNVPLWNFYGPTEATVWTTTHRVTHDDLHHASIPIGLPLAASRVYILDEALREVPHGEAGELHIGGANLARGYFNRPQLNAEKFIAHPFDAASHARLYKTGDLARMLPGGVIEYLGRLDHQVKVRGYRIELGEIEAALVAHPHIRDSVVIARKDDDEIDQRLIAYVVYTEHATSPRDLNDDLSAFLKLTLPAHLIPSSFVELESLPLTSNNKIDRRALSSMPPASPSVLPLNSNAETMRAQAVAHTEVERRLMCVWESVLKTSSVGVDDDFFRLGGDSLLAVQMLLHVEEEFGKRIPPATLITGATIAHLATAITTPDANIKWSPLVPVKTEGTRPPLFLVHPIGGEVFGYAPLAKMLGGDQPVCGLQAYGLDGECAPQESVEEMASAYLDEMLRIQPREPFLIGGYSFGGIVAYEMARQLYERRHTVALVAVLDEEAPRAPRLPAWHPRSLARFARNLPFWMRDSLLGRPTGEIMNAVARHTARIVRDRFARSRINVFGVETYEEQLSDMLDVAALPETHRRVSEALYRALIAYRPRPCPARVTLFRTKSQRLFDMSADDKGWNSLANGGVEIHFVAGNHRNMYEEPQASRLAAAMRASLEALAKSNS